MSKNVYGDENYDPNPNLKIWMNGNLVPTAEARISVFDHGLLYGDGVFEGIRSYNGRVFEREAHLKRFYNSAKAISLRVPFEMPVLDRGLDEVLEANGLLTPEKDAYLRLVITRGVGMLGISPRRTWRPTVFIIADALLMYPKEMYEQGMPVIISSYTRNLSNAIPPRIKSLNYLNNILAKVEALDNGVAEAVMLNSFGFVAEATGDNIFIVRDGQLQTPPSSAGILEGVTRGVVMRLARQLGIETAEKDLVRLDLYSADECFLTGTGAEVIPVTKIDHREVGDAKVGPITKKLMAAFQQYARQAAPAAVGA